MKRSLQHPLSLLRRGLVALIAGAAAPALAEEPSSDVASQAAKCQTCHQGALSLAGKPLGNVTATLRVIAAGESKHPPITISLDLDDHNIEALATALTAAQ